MYIYMVFLFGIHLSKLQWNKLVRNGVFSYCANMNNTYEYASNFCFTVHETLTKNLLRFVKYYSLFPFKNCICFVFFLFFAFLWAEHIAGQTIEFISAWIGLVWFLFSARADNSKQWTGNVGKIRSRLKCVCVWDCVFWMHFFLKLR